MSATEAGSMAKGWGTGFESLSLITYKKKTERYETCGAQQQYHGARIMLENGE